MRDLRFAVAKIEGGRGELQPTLHVTLTLATQPTEIAIQSISLQCQLRIEPPRRAYDEGEQQRLYDLFGEPARFGRSMPPSFLWTHAQVTVPGFVGATTVDLPIVSTIDFQHAASKYCHALSAGELPLLFLFSGTIFYHDDAGALRVAPIPQTAEARVRWPVAEWQALREQLYPGTELVEISRSHFEALLAQKRALGLTTLDATLGALLAPARGRQTEPS